MLLHGYGLLALGSIALALTLQRPELLAVGSPALVVVVLGLFEGRYPLLTLSATRDAPRALEGELTTISLTLTSHFYTLLASDCENVVASSERSCSHSGFPASS
jgi:hypothetical protein